MEVKAMIEYLVDNVFVHVGNRVKGGNTHGDRLCSIVS